MTILLHEALAGHNADAPAIGAPDRVTLTFGGLRALTDKTTATLNALGIGRNDRVAIVLPNGPEMAAAFIAISAGATTAPLNPAYRADEFRFYLEDLNAKALIVQADDETPAVEVARELGIVILTLTPDVAGPAGTFSLEGPSAGELRSGGPAAAGDIALVLHTSGTTSRPKIVPLSHTNIAASARNIGATLSLAPEDRCLNIMPLFHIHGLIAAVSASLVAGASVYCTPGFNALRIFGWFEAVQPTWYTAVPTMHQAILSRAARNKEIVAKIALRFIRSSSSSLPPPVMHDLEEVFGAPVIESYGMTEASHQMTSNQLPPGTRKPGSVGAAAGPEVAIMDAAGALVAHGETGEVVIRGENVTTSYENNPDANATAFTDGWFRTGDQGILDDDGFLTITGRLKEIINRGGEKIAPVEVDNVLMAHAAVAQAVTFAVPHDKLGEDVAAVVVLHENATADEKSLRAFVAEHLAGFKVPRRIVILDEIPKGATGKVQRIGLAEKLNLSG
ncbi:MAG: AMP-binding protein [Alphaproteobacteria bacterium]|nr:AMP-binding protein [Alphaproteobacteria bacterium]